MSAFTLIRKFHAERADINALLDEWIELSKTKGWPTTEEGLRRYLVRLQDNGGNYPPRRPSKSDLQKTLVPPAFVEWWKTRSEAGWHDDGSDEWCIPPLTAWRCLRYREQWEHQGKELKAA
jgi:hypothetical protein